MKALLYADPHLNPKRIDNLIESFAWMNLLAKSKKVDKKICLGDMTDRPNLTAEEITAMSRLDAQDHVIIAGNHCRADKDGKISSISMFENVVTEPGFLTDEIYILPYNSTKVDLSAISPRPKIILSHNDILGYDFGGKISTTGYNLSEILDNCDLFINGHLHNGAWIVENRIMNLGIMSGLNFSSCGGQWEPSVAILDTDTLKVELIENPYAYRYKKGEWSTIPKLKKYLDDLSEGKYVIQAKVPYKIADKVRKLLDQNDKVVTSRILAIHDKVVSSDLTKFEANTMSIYDKLREFVKKEDKNYDQNIINSIISEMEGSAE